LVRLVLTELEVFRLKPFSEVLLLCPLIQELHVLLIALHCLVIAILVSFQKAIANEIANYILHVAGSLVLRL